MNLLKVLLTVLGLKRETSIDSITKPMSKIVAKLENFAVAQADAAKTAEQRASELAAEAAERVAAAKQAEALASRYSSLTL